MEKSHHHGKGVRPVAAGSPGVTGCGKARVGAYVLGEAWMADGLQTEEHANVCALGQCQCAARLHLQAVKQYNDYGGMLE